MVTNNGFISTHRCPGSLRARASIRLTEPYKNLYFKDEPAWWLYHIEHNTEYDAILHCPSFKISYCPFCGVELSNIEQ